jgi:hypothetical protein
MATKKTKVNKVKPMAAKKPTTKKAAPKKQSKKNQGLLSRVQFKPAVLVLSVLLFALVGSYFLFSSQAAAPTLTWAPPTGYQNYPVYNVSVSSSNNQTLDGKGGDMLIKMPSTATGPISIKNCKNAVLIGGHIDIPKNTGPAVPDVRGVYINNCTGTVHIEGLYINGDIATAEADGVAISSPDAIVQLQNIRINKLYGGYETSSHNHSDIVQPWGGVKELRIDYMTGTSNYQGFQINDDINHIGKVIIKNTNIGDSGVPSPDSKGGYFAWLKCGTGTTYSFSNFYVQPRSGRNLGNTIYDSSAVCGMKASTTTATFTNSAVSGVVIAGKPTTGDFVPAGVAGTGYKSPGYGGSTAGSGGTTTGGTTSGGTTTTPTTPTTPSTPTTPTTSTPKEVISSSYDSSSTSMQAVLSSWAISGGRYGNTAVKKNIATNSNLAVNPTVVAGNFNLSVNAKVKGTSSSWDDLSVIFGYKDTNSYYYASFNESNDDGTSGVFVVTNGAKRQLKDISTVIKADTDYKVTVVRSGDTIKVSLNGKEVASVNDATYTSGKVGYGSMNNQVSYDIC